MKALVVAIVLSVTDGDTFVIKTDGVPYEVVRVAGLDTPEIKGRCRAEVDLAHAARERAGELLGDRVMIERHKVGYYGRTIASVQLEDGRDFTSVMIAEGLGRAYHQGRRRSWCN